MIGKTNVQMSGGSGSTLSVDNYISYIITTADGGGATTSLNINQTWILQNPNKRIGILVNRPFTCEVNLNASISFNSTQVDTLVPFARVPGTPSAWFGIIKPKKRKDITSIAGSISGNTTGAGIHITMFEIPEFFVGSIMMGARLTNSGQSRTFDLESTGLKPPFYFYSATVFPSIGVSELYTKCYLMPKYGVVVGQCNGFYIGVSDTNPTMTYLYQSVNNIDPFIIY